MRLDKNFVVLKPDFSIETLAVTPGIYQQLDQQLDQQFNQFKSHLLISSFCFESDWDSWERHPAGDETVVLLSGEAQMIMQTSSGIKTVELTEIGSCVIIPKNIWHTAKINNSAQLLFITPGEGTEHRAK